MEEEYQESAPSLITVKVGSGEERGLIEITIQTNCSLEHIKATFYRVLDRPSYLLNGGRRNEGNRGCIE